MRPSIATLLALCSPLLPAATPAAAAPLSQQAVSGFFDALEAEAGTLVQSGDYAGLVAWIETRVAPEAVFSLNGQALFEGRRQDIDVPQVSKPALLQVGRIAVEILKSIPENVVRDYEIDIELAQSEPVGPHSARAKTRIVETGTLMMAGTQGDGQWREARPVPFEAVADCEHMVQRKAPDSPLQLGMTMCSVDVKL